MDIDALRDSYQVARHDAKTASLIEEALKIQKNSGGRKAAAYLTGNGVSFLLTVRVLWEPENRRRNVHDGD